MCPIFSLSSMRPHCRRSPQQVPTCGCSGYFIREDLFPRTPEGYIMLPCPICHEVPAAASSSSSSSFTPRRHKTPSTMNETEVSPLPPAATIPAIALPTIATPTTPSSTLSSLLSPTSRSSFATTSATSTFGSSSSTAAPSCDRLTQKRTGFKRSFKISYPGMGRFEPYENPQVAPPSKKPRRVKQQAPKPVREPKLLGRPLKLYPGMGYIIFKRNHEMKLEEASNFVQHW